jgi:hypothetical protein
VANSEFTRLISRHAGSSRRRKASNSSARPVFVAHVAPWWDEETTRTHLEACATGRGADGRWKPYDELSSTERWVHFWEFRCEDGTWLNPAAGDNCQEIEVW